MPTRSLLARLRRSGITLGVAALMGSAICVAPAIAQRSHVDRTHDGGRLDAPRRAITLPNYQIVTLASFNGLNGGHPAGALTGDGAGNFYGTTLEGGQNNMGVIFKYSVSGGLTAVASFSGGYTFYGLTNDGFGNLFGTITGEAFGDGVIFQYSDAGGVQIVASFNGPTTGAAPDSQMVSDDAGNLYGTTSSYYGVGIFEYSAWGGLRQLATFVPPYYATLAPPALDPAGNIYITTPFGGQYKDGAILEYSAGAGLTQIASFDSSGGAEPSGLTYYEGALYGTTLSANSPATIFAYSQSGGLQTLATFGGDSNGLLPNDLVADGAGHFFGVSGGGGAFGHGAIFAYSAVGGIQTIADFTGANGAQPVGPLLVDIAGNLYGTTSAGGEYGDGAIFEVQPIYNVSGVISLGGCVNLAQPITFAMRPSSGASFSDTVTLGADGSYALTNVPNGTYTIAIKGAEWLQSDVRNVVVNSSNVSGVNATLLPGDANGDNVVNLLDFSILAAAYGTKVGDPDWNSAADFNCDGVVDLNDFNLLATDYGLTGDP